MNTPENTAWTTYLGRLAQQLSEEGATDSELAALEHNMTLAFSHLRFIRKCYSKESSRRINHGNT